MTLAEKIAEWRGKVEAAREARIKLYLTGFGPLDRPEMYVVPFQTKTEADCASWVARHLEEVEQVCRENAHFRAENAYLRGRRAS